MREDELTKEQVARLVEFCRRDSGLRRFMNPKGPVEFRKHLREKMMEGDSAWHLARLQSDIEEQRIALIVNEHRQAIADVIEKMGAEGRTAHIGPYLTDRARDVMTDSALHDHASRKVEREMVSACLSWFSIITSASCAHEDCRSTVHSKYDALCPRHRGDATDDAT